MPTKKHALMKIMVHLSVVILLCLTAARHKPDFSDIDLGPARPAENEVGLPEYNAESPGQVDEASAAEEWMEFLQPGTKDALEAKNIKKQNAIFQVMHGVHRKKGEDYYFDTRCQAARDLGEFIDDPRVFDLVYEYAIWGEVVPNLHFAPTITASLMKAGSAVLPRLLKDLETSPSWFTRNRILTILVSNKKWGPEEIDKVIRHHLLHDPSEDVRGPLARMVFEPYGAGPFPEDLEKLALGRLYEEDNLLVKWSLLWRHYYSMDFAKKDTGNMPLFRDLMFNGKNYESRWLGLEAIRMGRASRDPEHFPEYERDALPDVIKVLRNDPNCRTRFGAIDTLYVFTNMTAILALAEAMEKDTDPDIRAYAGRVLGVKVNAVNKYPWMARYPERARKFLDKKVAEAPDAATRGKVTAAFGRALLDPDPFVRYYAVIGLGKLNSPEALRLLKNFKPDAESWINEEVAKWVRQIESPDNTLFWGCCGGF